MIVITLGPEQMLEPGEDDLGRDRVGYSRTMSPAALYDANHGTWHLGERASRERYALIAFQGKVVQAIEIRSIEPVAGTYAGRESSRRSVIHGEVLAKGHPIHDKYVAKPSPIPPQRNPVGYYDAPEDHTPCLCGCGEATPAGKDFITGHDQTALHNRVRQIGTVRQFMDWFDSVHGDWPDINVVLPPTSTRTNKPTGEPPRRRHMLHGCAHFYTDETDRIINPIRLATANEMASLRPCTDCMSTSAKAALGTIRRPTALSR